MKPQGFDDFFGMDALIGRLKGVAGDPVHAYLFCGPEGTGKRSLAAIAARALNCQGQAAQKPCDTCPSCARYLSGNHPDHIVVRSEKAIGVDDVRGLVERVSIKPYEGGRHTVAIEDADAMTVQAQNALLKTLEEPPGDAVFFLLAKSASPLLSTVRSRVRLVRFPPLGDEAVRKALEKLGMAPLRANALAQLSEGSVGRALTLDADQDYWALRERVMASLMKLRGPGDVAAAFALIKDDKALSAQALGIMEGMALERLRAREARDDASDDGIALDGAKLLTGVMRVRQMIQSNVSWQSAVEMMYFDLI